MPVTPMEIAEAQDLVNSMIVGTPLGAVPELTEDHGEGLTKPVFETVLTIADCLHLAGTGGTEVFLGGTQRMAQVWHDLSTVQRILEIMERAEVLGLMAAAPGTSVQLGDDLDMAVVSKAYDSHGKEDRSAWSVRCA